MSVERSQLSVVDQVRRAGPYLGAFAVGFGIEYFRNKLRARGEDISKLDEDVRCQASLDLNEILNDEVEADKFDPNVLYTLAYDIGAVFLRLAEAAHGKPIRVATLEGDTVKIVFERRKLTAYQSVGRRKINQLSWYTERYDGAETSRIIDVRWERGGNTAILKEPYLSSSSLDILVELVDSGVSLAQSVYDGVHVSMTKPARFNPTDFSRTNYLQQ